MSAHLLFGYSLGDLGSRSWHREQAGRFGKDSLDECGGVFDWLLRVDDYKALPDAVSRKVLEAWYTPDDIAEIEYPRAFLQEQKLITVEQVGGPEDLHLVLVAYPGLRTWSTHVVRVVDGLIVSENTRRSLGQAYRALKLSHPQEDVQPRWLLAEDSDH